jgi:hypothetical protein
MEAMLPAIDRLVADTGNATGEIRTTIIHGCAHVLEVEENGSRDVEVWAKFSARKGGIKGRMYRYASGDFDACTDKVRALIERWHQLRKDLKPTLEFLDFCERL